MRAPAMWQKRRLYPASGGESFHERNAMFTKCANWNCSQPFRYSRCAVVLRVETPADTISSGGEPPVSSRVDYHWLCAECLRVILISLEDHRNRVQFVPGAADGAPAKIVKLTSLEAALAELAKSREGAQPLVQARNVNRAENIDRTQNLERTNAEGHSGMPEYKEAPFRSLPQA